VRFAQDFIKCEAVHLNFHIVIHKRAFKEDGYTLSSLFFSHPKRKFHHGRMFAFRPVVKVLEGVGGLEGGGSEHFA